MKAILIEFNGKPVAITQLCDLTTKQYLDLQKECIANLEKLENEKKQLQKKIDELKISTYNLELVTASLQQQIKVITGEYDEEIENKENE